MKASKILDLENVRTGEKKKKTSFLKTLALAIYRLRVLIILHNSPKLLQNYKENYYIKFCTFTSLSTLRLSP